MVGRASQWRDGTVATPQCIAALLVAGLCSVGVHQSQPISFSIAAFSEAFVVLGWGVSADLKKTQAITTLIIQQLVDAHKWYV